MALLIPVSFFITTAVEGRVRNAEQVHDGWCIPDPVDATLAAKCN